MRERINIFERAGLGDLPLDLTPEQRDRLILVCRDRLGTGFHAISRLIGWHRRRTEARYWRLRGLTLNAVEFGRRVAA